MSHDKRTLRVVVNGEDANLSLPVICKLRGARRFALKQTRNFGRPAEDWEIYSHLGIRLDESIAIGDLPEGQVLFLALRTGVGGNKSLNVHWTLFGDSHEAQEEEKWRN